MARGRKRNSGLIKGKNYFDDAQGGITYKGFYNAIYNVDKEAARELTKLNKLPAGKDLNHKFFKTMRFKNAHIALDSSFFWGLTPQRKEYWWKIWRKLKYKHSGDTL